MLKIYGNMLCPDCVACRADLDGAQIAYEYLDIGTDIKNLKEFLRLREDPVFTPIKESGSIGIPCIVTEQGRICFDWTEFM